MASKSKSNFLLLLSAITLIIIVGGLFFGKYFSSPSTSPSSDSTANWKTYTNTKYGFELKYPDTYQLREFKPGPNVIGVVAFDKEIKWCVGCGFSSNDEIQKGSEVYIDLLTKKGLTESDFKKEYGINSSTEKAIINSHVGYLQFFNKPEVGERSKSLNFYLGGNDGKVLSVGFNVGFDTTNIEFENYLVEFDQILSTFKFL